MNRWTKSRKTTFTIAIGLAAGVCIGLATRGRGPQGDATVVVRPPGLLPAAPDVARLKPGSAPEVVHAAHLESGGGGLEFGPPPLGAPPAAAVKAAAPLGSVRQPPTVRPAPPANEQRAAVRVAQPEVQSLRRLPVVAEQGSGVRGQGSGGNGGGQKAEGRGQRAEGRGSPAASELSQPRVAMEAPLDRPAVPAHEVQWRRQMQSVAQRADEKIRAAFETCGRGALYAGRSELIQALRLIAQNADALQGGSVHSDALAAGMRAMAEAESFAPRGSRLESELDLAQLVASHRTPVVREALAGADRDRKVTPLEAQNRYYTYAQQQLAAATAGVPVGAVALYGLGKVHSAQAAADSESRSWEEPQAMTMYQAALIADPGNPLAAHEMGVLLARYQRYDEAVAMLQHSARIASLPETWHNLALVHDRRGETDLARRARQEAESARARLSASKPASHPALARGSVRWLSAAQFAQTRPADTNLRPAGQPQPPSTVPVPAKEPSKPSGILSWLPWTKKG